MSTATVQRAGRVVGEPFNPWRGSCGFYPPDLLWRQKSIGDGPKALYERLCRRAGQDGHCFPSQGTLAGDLGKSDRQIRKDLTTLKTLGLIDNKWREGRRSNTYVFLWHPLFDAKSERNSGSGQIEEIPDLERNCSSGQTDSGIPDSSGRERNSGSGLSGTVVPTNSVSECYTGKAASEAVVTAQFVYPEETPAAPPSLSSAPNAEAEAVRQALEAGRVQYLSGDPETLIGLAEAALPGNKPGTAAAVLCQFIREKSAKRRIERASFFLKTVPADLPKWDGGERGIFVHLIARELERQSARGTATPEEHAAMGKQPEPKPAPKAAAIKCGQCSDKGITYRTEGAFTVESTRCNCETGAAVTQERIDSDNTGWAKTVATQARLSRLAAERAGPAHPNNSFDRTRTGIPIAVLR